MESESSLKLNFEISAKDLKFIIPVTQLILRVGALWLDEDSTPRNLYKPLKPTLPESILDKKSYQAGQFLVQKYACQQKLFGLSNEDLQALTTVDGPKHLLQRLKNSKGVTLRRSTIKTQTMTEAEKKETKRLAHVKKQSTIVDCISSEMNACQALVKPDCSKTALQKSTGIKKALKRLLSYCIPYTDYNEMDKLIEQHGLIFLDLGEVPQAIRKHVTIATVEFAGVKFKTKATTGEEYLDNVKKGVIGRLMKPSSFPNLNRIVICEEKYSYTPDDFKAATRVKRKKETGTSISHLKPESKIISSDKISKSAVIHTEIGKKLIGNYLAKNIQTLDLKHDLVLDIDSELILTNCPHSDKECDCKFKSYCTPIRAAFSKLDGFQKQIHLESIKQRKGEAEMSQVDWLKDIKDELREGEATVSVVTSADIDSIVIHLFALAQFWPRHESGSFRNKVFILLQKQKSELYDITGIIELFEARFSHSTCNIAVALCMGGNNFIPKLHGFSHEKLVTVIMQADGVMKDLVNFTCNDTDKIEGKLNEQWYLDIVKKLYCPLNLIPDKLTFDEVRQISVQPPGKPVRHPKLWMPPRTALLQLKKLIDCQIAYLLMAGKHDADLPNFLKDGCLKKDVAGSVQFDFGENAKVDNVEDILVLDEKELKLKMINAATCKKRKRVADGTPVKNPRQKRKPMMSTPR